VTSHQAPSPDALRPRLSPILLRAIGLFGWAMSSRGLLLFFLEVSRAPSRSIPEAPAAYAAPPAARWAVTRREAAAHSLDAPHVPAALIGPVPRSTCHVASNLFGPKTEIVNLTSSLPPSSLERCPMRILVINNTGGGFADHVDVAEGLTVQGLFAQQVPHGRAADYLVRVNRQPVPAEQVLREGDRVSITPLKIEGACLAVA
jgi:sulfur carrier protein ThiS